MALSALMMIKTVGVLKAGHRIAAFGYPDMIGPIDHVRNCLGEKFERLEYHKDSEEICRRHGLSKRQIPDTDSFFQLLGAEMDVFDIVKERGREILCDLNRPIEQKESYDVVLDPGTLEHCFNIGQAAFNMAGLLRKDGVILHQNPFNVGNHGFYGLNPTWYADFYGQNGFKLLDCRLCTSQKVWKTPVVDRFKFPAAEEAGIFAMAQREEVKELSFPVQTKYRRMHESR